MLHGVAALSQFHNRKGNFDRSGKTSSVASGTTRCWIPCRLFRLSTVILSSQPTIMDVIAQFAGGVRHSSRITTCMNLVSLLPNVIGCLHITRGPAYIQQSSENQGACSDFVTCIMAFGGDDCLLYTIKLSFAQLLSLARQIALKTAFERRLGPQKPSPVFNSRHLSASTTR
jgi:hypothetical protein